MEPVKSPGEHTSSRSLTSPFILMIPIVLVLITMLVFLFSFYRDTISREIENYKKLQMQELELTTNAFSGTLLSYIDKIRVTIEEEGENTSIFSHPGPTTSLTGPITDKYR